MREIACGEWSMINDHISRQSLYTFIEIIRFIVGWNRLGFKAGEHKSTIKVCLLAGADNSLAVTKTSPV
jgi:hypothetical protein